METLKLNDKIFTKNDEVIIKGKVIKINRPSLSVQLSEVFKNRKR